MHDLCPSIIALFKQIMVRGDSTLVDTVVRHRAADERDDLLLVSIEEAICNKCTHLEDERSNDLKRG